MLLLGLALAGFSVLAQTTESVSISPHIHLIVVDGGINPAVDDYIKESITRAHASGAKALVIQLDTPGGLLSSTRSIVKEILGAPLPVLVYVAPSGAGAGSAGVFITLAGHIAAMAPGTNIGAAHPVAGGGQEVKGVMGEKIENFTASFSETIAERRGRNTEFAIQAVRRSISITDKEALEKNVIDIIAHDLRDLLKQAEGREVDINGTKQKVSFKGVRVQTFEMALRQKIIDILSDPNIAYLLLMAGILGLYMEFSNPGVIFPGVAGGIAILLALTSFQILPINYGGLALILLGLALLVGEAFLPSFGVLGIGGIISLTLGSLLLFDTQGSDLVLDKKIVFTAVGTLSALMVVVGYLVVQAHRRKPTLGVEGLLGETAEVKVRLNPEGKVFVHGEFWNAEGEGEIDVGEKVKVAGFDGMMLKVKRLVGS
jgi:membrane-bound serine protease (ClpP class)